MRQIAINLIVETKSSNVQVDHASINYGQGAIPGASQCCSYRLSQAE
ncbi:MAG: hypothetical protein OEQ18_02875 [Gammaproteobacteria bacterium]|nr:hypothetical protein [Gammaproteobacteria bacterium]